MDNFAAFILTHGRPDKVYTLDALVAAGYTGRYYLVIDNEDDKIEEYKDRFGADKVVVFDKAAMAERVDEGDNFEGRGVVLYARNACFDIAKDLGLDYFVQLDDDYNHFTFRFVKKGRFRGANITDMDQVVGWMVDYLEKTGAMAVAFAQGGDFIGGAGGRNWREGVLRKAMNSYFCKTDRRFWFRGKMNDDVNTYVTLGKAGGVFLTITDIMLNQKPTQSQDGGITDFYIEYGTYFKSFMPVMMNPTAVKIGMMGNKDLRIHHKVLWSKAVPKILNERYKKVIK